MKLALHRNEAEITLSISEENRIYVMNYETIFNQGKSLLEGHTGTLILDLDCIKYIDSAGFSSLIRLHNYAHNLGKRLRLQNLSEYTLELFDILKLSELFDLQHKVTKVSPAA